MKSYKHIFAIVFTGMSMHAPAGQGPAGASGACSHVLGPIGIDGQPLGFTCTDVGGSALLIWNAAQLTEDLSITGGIKTVNYHAGSFSVDGAFKSDGDLAFIGGEITINGTLTGANVLIAGIDSTPGEISTTLLGSGRIIATATSNVFISSTAKISASKGNIVITGAYVSNRGEIVAKSGSIAITTGTKLDIGWKDVVWQEGTFSFSTNNAIENFGSMKASGITLEARRTSSGATTIFNRGVMTAKKSVTFITGTPAVPRGDGTYVIGTAGVTNGVGTIHTAKIIISPFYPAQPGGQPTDGNFQTDNKAQLEILTGTIGGATDGVTDNTPTSDTSAVIDSTRTGASTFTATSNIVIPQLAPSMTHLNATSQVMKPTLVASNGASEQVRGESTQPVTAKPKSRVKAKPVLVRGAFFDSKISATITPNP